MARLGICVLVMFAGLLGVRCGELYWKPNQADKIGRADKLRVYWLSEEILKDLETQIRQLEGIRLQHESSLLFELGAVLGMLCKAVRIATTFYSLILPPAVLALLCSGQVKEKYKRQVEIYRQIFLRFNGTTLFMSPEDGLRFRPLHYLIALEFIVAKQLEIEQLVEICMRVPREELFVFTPPPQKVPVASKFPRLLRARGLLPAEPAPADVEHVFNRMAEEERLKMRLRAEYKKRHGKDGKRK